METETRTRIAERDDAIDAAFTMFRCIANDPSNDSKLNGAQVRPAERISRVTSDGEVQKLISYEVTHVDEHETALPEPERVLLPA
jgi:hypothetical protein